MIDHDDDSEIGLAAQEGLSLIAQARALEVSDTPSFQRAAEFLRAVAGHVRRVKELFAPMKQSAQAAHRAVVAQEQRLLEGPEAAARVVRDALAAYESAQRREAAIAQARAAEEAQRSAAVVVPLAVDVPTAVGISFSTRWSAVVVDHAAFVRAVAAVPALHHLLLPNQKALDEMARSSQGALVLAGVEARETRVTSARAS